jgi:hypothetical protein
MPVITKEEREAMSAARATIALRIRRFRGKRINMEIFRAGREEPFPDTFLLLP